MAAEAARLVPRPDGRCRLGARTLARHRLRRSPGRLQPRRRPRPGNQLFVNDGAGHFRDISLSNPDLCARPNIARGLAYGDIDNDGKLDLLVTSVVGRARLYHNVASPGGHWLSIRAVLPEQGERDALGAEIRVRAGQRSWLRWINPATSFLCSNDPRAHFGLGSTDQVDDITVLWPDGSRETFPGGRIDCQLTLQKGKGIK
jgi:hypothetical protein